MAKKLTFEKLPEAVERILEILGSEDSNNVALRLLVGRMALLEKKIDHLEKSISPDRPTMDKPAVLKALKIRPKMLNELEMSGVLPSHSEGRKTLFYESDVVKFFMTQPQWLARAASKSRSEESDDDSLQNANSTRQSSAAPAIAETGRQRIDINGVSAILGRTPGAIRQQLTTLPHYKDGRRIYFYSDEVREWAKSHAPRKRRRNVK